MLIYVNKHLNLFAQFILPAGDLKESCDDAIFKC